MRCLINDISSINKYKQIAFGKCYNNNEGVNAIIKIESDIGSSVNQTKQTIFDNLT